MQYCCYYTSPLGEMLLAADDIGLTGLWFVGQTHFGRTLTAATIEQETPVLADARRWLDNYFSGKRPEHSLPLHLIGTDFQREVWNLLCAIPYGTTVTYGALARELAKRQGKKALSAQAVGAAVGKNPISVIVPCHRVLGANGSLTGYAGGLDRKAVLLQLEQKYI